MLHFFFNNRWAQKITKINMWGGPQDKEDAVDQTQYWQKTSNRFLGETGRKQPTRTWMVLEEAST